MCIRDRDSWSQSCTLLADMFGICAEEMEDKGDDQQKLKLDGKEYYIGRTVQPIMAAAKNILAAEDAGNPAVFYFTLGQGELLLLPFSLEPTDVYKRQPPIPPGAMALVPEKEKRPGTRPLPLQLPQK